jgi:hypothetical protein
MTIKWASQKIDYLHIGVQASGPPAEGDIVFPVPAGFDRDEVLRAEAVVADAVKRYKHRQWLLWGDKRTH